MFKVTAKVLSITTNSQDRAENEGMRSDIPIRITDGSRIILKLITVRCDYIFLPQISTENDT